MKNTEVTIRYNSVKKQSDRIGVSVPTYYRGMNKEHIAQRKSNQWSQDYSRPSSRRGNVGREEHE